MVLSLFLDRGRRRSGRSAGPPGRPPIYCRTCAGNCHLKTVLRLLRHPGAVARVAERVATGIVLGSVLRPLTESRILRRGGAFALGASSRTPQEAVGWRNEDHSARTAMHMVEGEIEPGDTQRQAPSRHQGE